MVSTAMVSTAFDEDTDSGSINLEELEELAASVGVPTLIKVINQRFVQIPVTTVRMTTYLPTQRVAPSLLETNKEMMDYPSFVVMILTVVAV
jgi:hypothetical protein